MPRKDPEATKAYQRTYQLEKYYRWMTEARERLGGQCVVCGTTDDLQFDHIDPTTKLFTLGSRRVARPAWDAEVAKCQLLCVAHHKEKTIREQRTQEHGTWAMFKTWGCRCDVCREFVNGYQRKYKRERRKTA